MRHGTASVTVPEVLVIVLCICTKRIDIYKASEVVCSSPTRNKDSVGREKRLME